MADRALHFFTGSVRATADRLENAVLPLERGDHRLSQDLDVRPRGNALDQIARHARIETGTTNNQPDLRDLAGQINSCLAGGIARAYQRHFLPRAQPSLKRRCPIVDARALESCEIFDIESAIPCAAGDDDRAGAGLLLVGEGNQKASSAR